MIINDLLKKGEILNFCDGKEWRWKNDQGETRIGRKWRLITRWVVINHFNFYWPHTAANMGLEMNLYDGNDQFSFLWVNYKKKKLLFLYVGWWEERWSNTRMEKTHNSMSWASSSLNSDMDDSESDERWAASWASCSLRASSVAYFLT